MGPGLVVITVLGHNIPQGPQNYSLVALGDFNGSFESAFNPAWDGVSEPPLPRISSMQRPPTMTEWVSSAVVSDSKSHLESHATSTEHLHSCAGDAHQLRAAGAHHHIWAGGHRQQHIWRLQLHYH